MPATRMERLRLAEVFLEIDPTGPAAIWTCG